MHCDKYFVGILAGVISCVLLASCNSSSAETEERTVKDTSNDSIRFNVSEPASAPRAEVCTAYTRAIEEYLKAAYTGDTVLPDTLFIGNPLGLPDIQLPLVIRNTNIRPVTSEEHKQITSRRSETVYLNVIGWQNVSQREFIIVTFLNYAVPQHTCHLYLEQHAVAKNEFTLDSLAFEFSHANSAKDGK